MLTLETAKQLKEAGWNKPCSNIWVIYTNGKPELIKATPFLQTKIRETEYYFPCPTTDELLEALPEINLCQLLVAKYRSIMDELKYQAGYENTSTEQFLYGQVKDSPVECLAQLWLKLKKEGLIK